MSEKLTCPGCDAHTSSVLAAFHDGAPCPYCGLSASAAAEIDGVRSSRANKEVADRLVDALKRADKAEAEARSYRAKLDRIRAVMGSEDPDEWDPEP